MLFVFTQKHVGLENRAKVQHLNRGTKLKRFLFSVPGLDGVFIPPVRPGSH